MSAVLSAIVQELRVATTVLNEVERAIAEQAVEVLSADILMAWEELTLRVLKETVAVALGTTLYLLTHTMPLISFMRFFSTALVKFLSNPNSHISGISHLNCLPRLLINCLLRFMSGLPLPFSSCHPSIVSRVANIHVWLQQHFELPAWHILYKVPLIQFAEKR